MPEDEFESINLQEDLEKQDRIETAVEGQTNVNIKKDGQEVEATSDDLETLGAINLSEEENSASSAMNASVGINTPDSLSGAVSLTNGSVPDIEDNIQKVQEYKSSVYKQRKQELKEAYKDSNTFERFGLGVFALGANALDEAAFGAAEVLNEAYGSDEARAEQDFFDEEYYYTSNLGAFIGIAIPALFSGGATLAAKLGLKGTSTVLSKIATKATKVLPTDIAFKAIGQGVQKVGAKAVPKVIQNLTPKAIKTITHAAGTGAVQGAIYGAINGLPPNEGSSVGSLEKVLTSAVEGAKFGAVLGGGLTSVIKSAQYLNKKTRDYSKLAKDSATELFGGSKLEVVKRPSAVYVPKKDSISYDINIQDDIVAVKALSVYDDFGQLTSDSSKHIGNYVKSNYNSRPVDGLIPDVFYSKIKPSDTAKALVDLQNRKNTAYRDFNAKKFGLQNKSLTRASKEVTPTIQNISEDIQAQSTINVLADSDALRKTSVSVNEAVPIINKATLTRTLEEKFKKVFVGNTEEAALALSKLKTLRHTYNGIGRTSDNIIKGIQKEIADINVQGRLLNLEGRQAANELYKLKLNNESINKYKQVQLNFKTEASGITNKIKTKASTIATNNNEIKRLTNEYNKLKLDGDASNTATHVFKGRVNKLKTVNQGIEKSNIAHKTELKSVKDRKDNLTRVYNQSKLKAKVDKAEDLVKIQQDVKDKLLNNEARSIDKSRISEFLKAKEFDKLVKVYPKFGKDINKLKEIDKIEQLVEQHKTSDAFNFFKQFNQEVKSAKSIQQLEALSDRVDDLAGSYAKAGQPTNQSNVQNLAKQAKRLLGDQIDDQLVQQFNNTKDYRLLEKIMLRRMRSGNIKTQDALLKALGYESSVIREVRAIQTTGASSSSLIAAPLVGVLKTAQLKAASRKIKALRSMFNSQKEYHKFVKKAGFDTNNPTQDGFHKAFGLKVTQDLSDKASKIQGQHVKTVHTEEHISLKNIFYRELISEPKDIEKGDVPVETKDKKSDKIKDDVTSVLKSIDVAYLQGLDRLEISEVDSNKFVSEFDNNVGSYYEAFGDGFSESIVGTWGHIVNKYGKSLSSKDRHQMVNVLNKPYRTLDVILHNKGISLTDGAVIALREAYPSIAASTCCNARVCFS